MIFEEKYFIWKDRFSEKKAAQSNNNKNYGKDWREGTREALYDIYTVCLFYLSAFLSVCLPVC
jgi:hypothetical protein